MEHHGEHELSHRQERELEKEEQRHSEPSKSLSSLHPAWYVVVAVISVGIAVLIWTFAI